MVGLTLRVVWGRAQGGADGLGQYKAHATGHSIYANAGEVRFIGEC